MNKIFTFLALFLCFATTHYGQTVVNYYNKGKFLSDQAFSKLPQLKTLGKAEVPKIIELFKSAADNYQQAESAMPGTRYLARYNAAVNLYQAAILYHESGDDANAYAVLKQSIDLWPNIDDIPLKTVAKEKSIYHDGFIYTFPAACDTATRIKNYYLIRYEMTKVAATQGKKEEAIAYGKEIADHVTDMPDLIWESACLIAEQENKDNLTCDAGHYALISLENAAKIQPKGDEARIAAQNKEIDEMVNYITLADSQGCLKTSMLERAVVAVASMQGSWTMHPKFAYNKGEKVYNDGSKSFNLCYNEYRLARTHNDPDISEKWRLRLVENGKHFTSEEWKTLADYYYTLSYNEARTDALDQSKKAERKEHTAFMIAVEPTCAPILGQYAATIGFFGLKVMHELRFGYIASGLKPFLKSESDTEKVPLYLLTHYHGYQASYTFKVLSNGDKKNTWNYLGAEFRYTDRDYTDSITYADKKNPTERKTALINPHADVFDACLLFGRIHRYKLLYTEIFGGVGVGYKMLSFNSSYDATANVIGNAPFKPDIWNKLYIPIRIGFRLGVALH